MIRYKLIEREILLCAQQDQLELLKKEFLSAIKDSKLTEERRQDHIRDIENLKVRQLSGEEEEDCVLTQSLTETHPQLSSFSNKIEIQYEKNRGRFAVAKRLD